MDEASKKGGKPKKSCSVPNCGWTEDSGKYLISFPVGRSRMEERQRWMEAVNIVGTPAQRLYCCEDHFVLSNDAVNYIRVKLMGGRLLLKPGVVPHRNLGLGGETDSADPTLSHFLLGSVPEQSQLDNFDVEVPGVEDVEAAVEVIRRELNPPRSREYVTRKPVTKAPVTRAPVTRAPSRHKLAALKRQQERSAHHYKPDLFKKGKHRPRILGGGKKIVKKSSDESEAMEDEHSVVSEPENIVVDVDLLEMASPPGQEDADVGEDPLGEDEDEDDPEPDSPFGYHFLTADSGPDVAGHPNKYGALDENGEIRPVVVVKKKMPEYIDVNELSEEEHCQMPSSSEDEFSGGKSDVDEDEEGSSRYFIRDLLCDIDDVDAEIHECIRRIEGGSYNCVDGNKRKAHDKIDDQSSRRKKKKKTKLKNGSYDCGSVVAMDSDTINGISEDGGDFVWYTQPCRNTCSDSGFTSSPVAGARDAATPLECFSLFFTEEMTASLINNTNEKIRNYRQRQSSRSKTFADIDDSREIKALVGLLVNVAATKDNHLPLSRLFDVGCAGARYRSIMSPQRLRLLLQCLTFDRTIKRDKLSPVRDIWEKFLFNCRSNYRPSQNVTVGDHVVRFTRKCPFIFSNVPEKYGLRNALMVDSCTKYLVDAVPLESARSSLQQLTDSVKSSHRNITFENPASVSSFSELLQYGLTAVGIVDRNSPELPVEMSEPDFHRRKLRSSVFIYREEMTAVSYKPNLTEVNCYVSSMHCEPEFVGNLPGIVVNYNSHKDGVRMFNKILDSVNCARRTKRWTLHFFFNILSMACANAYVVYLHNEYRRLSKDESGPNPLSRFDFLMKLVDQLTTGWVRRRIMMYGSLSEDLFEQTRRSVMGFVGNNIDCQNEDKVAGMVKCVHCPEEARAGLKTCVVCGHCKKIVCRDHLSNFCCKCLIKCCSPQ